MIDAATMKETDWLPCHDDAEAWIVTIGPNNQLFTGGDDSYFRIWDLKSHEPIVEKKFMAGQIRARQEFFFSEIISEIFEFSKKKTFWFFDITWKKKKLN